MTSVTHAAGLVLQASVAHTGHICNTNMRQLCLSTHVHLPTLGPSFASASNQRWPTRPFCIHVGCLYQYAKRRKAPPSQPSSTRPDSSRFRLMPTLLAACASGLPRTLLATPAKQHKHRQARPHAMQCASAHTATWMGLQIRCGVPQDNKQLIHRSSDRTRPSHHDCKQQAA